MAQEHFYNNNNQLAGNSYEYEILKLMEQERQLTNAQVDLYRTKYRERLFLRRTTYNEIILRINLNMLMLIEGFRLLSNQHRM